MGQQCSREAVSLSAINKATTKLFTAVTLHKPGLSQTKEACECTRMSVCMCVHANDQRLVRAEGLSVAILWLSTHETPKSGARHRHAGPGTGLEPI